MQKEFFDHLFLRVSHFDIRSSDTKQLVALLKLYRNVYSLIAVFPDSGHKYGGRFEIQKQAERIADALVLRIKQGVNGELEIKCLDSLLDYSYQFMNERWDGWALNRSFLLIEKYTGPEAKKTGGGQLLQEQEPSLCKLICTCFYHTEDDELAKEARKMVAAWYGHQSDNGEWRGLPLVTAIERLYASDACQDYTFDFSFAPFLQKGIDFYLKCIRFPGQESVPEEEQLHDYLHVAGLFLFVKKQGQRKELIERTEAIIEQYLKKKNGECSPARMISDNEIFSELYLNGMSVLVSCLMEHMSCSQKENKNLEKSIIESE